MKLPGLKTRSVVKEHVWKMCKKLSETHAKYQKLGSEMAEVRVREALEVDKDVENDPQYN